MSKFDRESPKVNQVIFSAPTSIPNMKALAQIRFEISCTQDFQNLFSKGHYSNKGHNMCMKKIQANYFFMRNLYMKFQHPIIHRSKVSNFTEKWKKYSKSEQSSHTPGSSHQRSYQFETKSRLQKKVYI